MTVALLPIIILMILVAGLAGVIALIANPSTRVIGLILLGIALMMPVLLVVMFFVRVSQPGRVDTATVVHEVVHTPPVEPVRSEAVEPAKQPKGGKVVTALAHAVGAALSPKGKKPPAAAAPAAPVEPPPKEPPRPAWVGAGPKLIDNAYFMTLKVGPYTTRLECEANLPEALQSAVSEYVELYLGPEAAKRVRLPADDLRQRLVREVWEEPVQSSIGPMVQLHVQTAFDTKTQEAIKDAWRRSIVADRLRRSGAVLAAVLGVLAVAYTVLKTGQRLRKHDDQPIG